MALLKMASSQGGRRNTPPSSQLHHRKHRPAGPPAAGDWADRAQEYHRRDTGAERGALSTIKADKIKVMKEVKAITGEGAKFVYGVEEEFDSIVLATGYKSDVPCWLKGTDFFTAEGMLHTPFPNGWNGGNGLYVVGFTGRGL